MKASTVALALAVAVAVSGFGTAMAQDALQFVAKRQDTMKAQGKALAAVKAYTEGKGDLAAARAAGAELVKIVPTLPSLFPQKTGMAEYPGKSYAKPAIWGQWDKFVAAVNVANVKANELNTALAGGDKAAVTAAFGAMGKDGCGGCHNTFREKKKS